LSIADFGTVSLFNPSKRIFNRLSVSSTILWIGAWVLVSSEISTVFEEANHEEGRNEEGRDIQDEKPV
jgi:hypothetical protein